MGIRSNDAMDGRSFPRKGVWKYPVFWLVSEESFWLCAYLDERDEVVQCASSALVGRAYSALENSMLAFFEEAIWNS